MRRALVPTLLGALLCLGGGAAADPKPFGTMTSVQLEKGRTARAAILADVDGDGQSDLVIASSRGGKHPGRAVEVHLRRSEGAAFRSPADLILDEDAVTADVVAFAVADVHEDAGSEVVLFTASGAFAWRPKGPEDARIVRLVAGSFLWQLADARELIPWETGLRDVDGDGLADIVLPEPGGWRIALQRRDDKGVASFASVSAPRIPGDDDAPDDDEPVGARKIDARARRNEVRIAITVGDEGEEPSRDLLRVSESSPAPQFLDWDADGRTDLLAQSSRELFVWTQREGGGFDEKPVAHFELPVVADRERRLDVSYGAHVADLDGDRRADCVMLAGDKRSDDVRTQVLVYVQGRNKAPDPASPLFGAQGLPTQLLRIAGFAGSPQLADVDGDGRPDLVVGSVRLDGALDAARAAASGSLDAEIYVFRNLGGSFSARPDLTLGMPVKAEGLRKARNEIVARFFGDVTGDGVRELFVRDEPEHVRVLMTRRSGDGLVVTPQPLWETHVAADAKVSLPAPKDGAAEILVLEDTQVLHVRFP